MQPVNKEYILNEISDIRRKYLKDGDPFGANFSEKIYFSKTKPKDTNQYVNPLTEFPIIVKISDAEFNKLESYNNTGGWLYSDYLTLNKNDNIIFDNKTFNMVGTINRQHLTDSLILKDNNDNYFQLSLTSENIRTLYINNADPKLVAELPEVKDKEILDSFKNKDALKKKRPKH